MKALSNIKKHKLMKSGKYVIYIYMKFFEGVDCCTCYRCNSLDLPPDMIYVEAMVPIEVKSSSIYMKQNIACLMF